MHLGLSKQLKGHLRDISHGLNLPNVQSTTISYVKLKSLSLGRFEASDPPAAFSECLDL